MKLVRFRDDSGQIHSGVLQGDTVIDITDTSSIDSQKGGFGKVLEFSARQGISALKEIVKGIPESAQIPFQNTNLTHPVSKEGRLIALGGVYTKHLQERGQKLTAVPSQWVVPKTAIVGPDHPIQLPSRISDSTMSAVELGVVIGEGGSYIEEVDAMSHVAGYTVVNDVTARTDWPGPMGYKLMDTFSPCGPWVTTADTIDSPLNLDMTLHLGEEKICQGSTAGMRFSLPFIIRFASSVVELKPGDVIATGDPGRVQRSLEVDEKISASIKDVGTLENDITEV